MSEWSDDMVQALLETGWHPGRQVETAGWRAHFQPSGLVMHEAARSFLAEFGGLRFRHEGPGIGKARERFDLDPMTAAGDEDFLLNWSRKSGKSLFPIGDYTHLDVLAMDENGGIYIMSELLRLFGYGREGFEHLTLGASPEVVFEALAQ